MFTWHEPAIRTQYHCHQYLTLQKKTKTFYESTRKYPDEIFYFHYICLYTSISVNQPGNTISPFHPNSFGEFPHEMK